jgi:hypothetical protein|tara:strand:+ start:2382 stop:2606 length:225 start_codon:yes stop_codon:yes gene_type:complete
MSKSKDEFLRLREQEIHEDKIDLQDMMKSMLFLPTGNRELDNIHEGFINLVDYLTKIKSNETGSIQPGHKACDK